MAYFCFLEKEGIQCYVLSCLIPWHKLDNLLIIVVQAFLVFFPLSSSSPFHMQAKVRAEQQITQSFPSEIITGLWYKNVMGMIIIQQWCNACSFSLHCGPILGYHSSFPEFQTFWSRSCVSLYLYLNVTGITISFFERSGITVSHYVYLSASLLPSNVYMISCLQGWAISFWMLLR